MAATENQASSRSALPKSPHFRGIATATDNAGNSVTYAYTFFAPWNNTTSINPGDVNGDGIPDLLATTGTDLLLYPGDTDPSAPIQTSGGCGNPASVHNGPCVASPQSGSPDGSAWNTYLITHRGSMTSTSVDDLFALKGANLYLMLNNPGSHDSPPQYSSNDSGGLTSIPAHPVCAPTADNAGNCATYPGGTQTPNTSNWSDVTQILAPGDAWTGSARDNGLPSLLTVENGELWLYQGQYGDSLGGSAFASNNPPVLLGSSAGTTSWSGTTLIAPGTVNGHVTIWARDNATGTIYSYPITIDANGLPTLDPSSPATPVTATSGTVLSGISLPASTYPAVASPGALDNSSYPGLYAETTTGTSPSGSSCTNGCLYYYPGQSDNAGQPLDTTTPRTYVGTLTTPASQLG